MYASLCISADSSSCLSPCMSHGYENKIVIVPLFGQTALPEHAKPNSGLNLGLV